MADPKAKQAPGGGGDSEEATKPEGRIRWVLGWVMVPSLLVGAIFGGGVHLGATNPESWYTAAVVWVVGLFG